MTGLLVHIVSSWAEPKLGGIINHVLTSYFLPCFGGLLVVVGVLGVYLGLGMIDDLLSEGAITIMMGLALVAGGGWMIVHSGDEPLSDDVHESLQLDLLHRESCWSLLNEHPMLRPIGTNNRPEGECLTLSKKFVIEMPERIAHAYCKSSSRCNRSSFPFIDRVTHKLGTEQCNLISVCQIVGYFNPSTHKVITNMQFSGYVEVSARAVSYNIHCRNIAVILNFEQFSKRIAWV